MLVTTYNKVADLLDGKGKKSPALTRWVHEHEKTIAGLEGYVRKEATQLQKLASQRDGVASKLKAAQSKLSTLQKEWTDEKNSIASGIMQGTSVVTDAPNGWLSGGDVVQHMQDQVQKALKFANDLQTLKNRGLNSDMIQQIAASGFDQGGATAAALAGANNSQLSQLNAMEKQLKGAADKTGASVADSMYGAGIQSAKGLIKGLQSQEKAIQALMVKIAKGMETAIRKALGIHSPSRVFHDIGRFITSGLAMGIGSNADEAVTATNNLVGAVTGASATKLRLPGATARAEVHHHVHVTVQGSVLAERDLTSTIQKVMGQNGARNTTTWASYRR
jgi:nucleoside diphosphate kinase